jgi:hypothetical protein
MGSLVALLATWVLWVQISPVDPVRGVSEHASLEECREYADRMNHIVADALARNTPPGEKRPDLFEYPFFCMPQGHVPGPRRQ